MKISIEHLPGEKQAEVHEIVEAINNRFPAEMIILFGSFARGDLGGRPIHGKRYHFRI
jgi:uncharacterized protein